MTTIEVDSFILELITKGDEVIELVRSLLPHGIGNQRRFTEPPGSQALLRTYAAQQLYGDDIGRYMRMAAATLKFGAGACHEVAALAYVAAREALSPSHVVCYITCDRYEHAFVTIGIPGTHPDDQVIVIDAWPIHAQAVRWSEHFCNDPGVKITLRQVKMCSGPKQKLTRAPQKHYASIDADAELRRVEADLAARGLTLVKNGYNHLYCTTSEERITYVRATTPRRSPSR